MTIEQTRQFCNERKKAKMNSCFVCKNGTVEHSVTTYMVDLKTCIVIIKNVPCEECTQCGEKYFTDSVMEKLEEIVKKVRDFASEVFVTDYAKLAAQLRQILKNGCGVGFKPCQIRRWLVEQQRQQRNGILPSS